VPRPLECEGTVDHKGPFRRWVTMPNLVALGRKFSVSVGGSPKLGSPETPPHWLGSLAGPLETRPSPHGLPCRIRSFWWANCMGVVERSSKISVRWGQTDRNLIPCPLGMGTWLTPHKNTPHPTWVSCQVRSLFVKGYRRTYEDPLEKLACGVPPFKVTGGCLKWHQSIGYLLAIHNSHRSLSYRFRGIRRFLSKKSLSSAFNAPNKGLLLSKLGAPVGFKKLEWWPYQMLKRFNNICIA